LIEYRLAEGQNDRLPMLAADLVSRQVDVITSPGSTVGALAAKAATTTIPIVFGTGTDPVAAGLVPSLSRPGGNITAITTLNLETVPKRLELLHELLPAATIMSLLVNPTNVPLAGPVATELQGAARKLGLRVRVLNASADRDFDSVFASLVQLRASALVIGIDAFFNSRIHQLAALTFRHRMPAVNGPREFAAAGGLMSYGSSLVELYRLVGVYTGRSLEGEKRRQWRLWSRSRRLVSQTAHASRLQLQFSTALLAGRA
jgi:putative tryptophan/tyrosine transport system substrate-binding protein